jgi:hypothetical protein
MHDLNIPYAGYGPWGPLNVPFALPILIVIVLWSLLWQAAGMWHSARRGEWIWFVIFLLVHTLGILEIIYLFIFAKMKLADVFKFKK